MKAASMRLVAGREIRLLSRSRATLGAMALLLAVAWLPLLLLPLRAGSLGLASFEEVLPLQMAMTAVVLPLLALLAGAELLAGELEDGSLIPTLSLPISRRACFAGKCLGRGVVLAGSYLVAFATAGAATVATHGTGGWQGWTYAVAGGLLLLLVTGGVGAALGAGGRGRVKAFGAALAAWVVLVFALDAVLLTAVVALAPPPPEGVGEHGHTELMAQRARPDEDPHARGGQTALPERNRWSAGLMTFNPISLFRLTTLAASPSLRQAFPGGVDYLQWMSVALAWLVWLAAPLGVGLRRFERADVG